MVVNEACNQEFFRAGKFSWDNASSINISATTNEQKASQQKKKEKKKKKKEKKKEKKGLFNEKLIHRCP